VEFNNNYSTNVLARFAFQKTFDLGHKKIYMLLHFIEINFEIAQFVTYHDGLVCYI